VVGLGQGGTVVWKNLQRDGRAKRKKSKGKEKEEQKDKEKKKKKYSLRRVVKRTGPCRKSL